MNFAKLKFYFLSALCLCVITTNVHANGVAYFKNETNGERDIRGMAVQPDGKTLVSGGYYGENYLVRLNVDGSVDSSFADKGYFKIRNNNIVRSFFDVKINSKNKIVILAYILDYPHRWSGALIQLNPDGSVDKSFGYYGFKEMLLTDNSVPSKLLIDGADNIYVLQEMGLDYGGNRDLIVSKLTAKGFYDLNFGKAGHVRFDISSEDIASRSITFDRKNRLLVSSTAGEDAFATVLRFNLDGSLDTTFALGGFLHITSWKGQLESFVFSEDDSIYALHVRQNLEDRQDSNVIVFKWNDSGIKDLSFGNEGQIDIPSYAKSDMRLTPHLFLEESKLFLVTTKKFGSTELFSYDLNGAVNAQFGDNGNLVLPISGQNFPNWSVLDNKKITIVGTQVKNSNYQNYLSRVNLDGTLDKTVGQSRE